MSDIYDFIDLGFEPSISLFFDTALENAEIASFPSIVFQQLDKPVSPFSGNDIVRHH